jgi:hypothetical protein
MKRAITTLAGLAVILGSAVGYAEIPPILRPGTRPMWASLGMGGAINVKDSGSQFKLTQDFGYHFTSSFGGPSAGPAIAIVLQEGFGNNFISFEIGPRFVWDIPVVQNLGLYLSPSLTLGYAYAGTSVDCGPYVDCGGGASAFNLGLAFAAKLILADRGMVFFQPFGIDMGIRGEGVSVRYDLIFGGGVIF